MFRRLYVPHNLLPFFQSHGPPRSGKPEETTEESGKEGKEEEKIDRRETTCAILAEYAIRLNSWPMHLRVSCIRLLPIKSVITIT